MQGWALSEYTVRFAQAAIFRLWTPSTVDRAWEVLANLFEINRAAKNAGNCVLCILWKTRTEVGYKLWFTKVND